MNTLQAELQKEVEYCSNAKEAAKKVDRKLRALKEESREIRKKSETLNEESILKTIVPPLDIGKTKN